MRDKQGKFLRGHAALPDRDPKTGKFIRKLTMDSGSEYAMASKEINAFLKKQED